MERGTEELPDAFTFPFRYTPHPLCQRAALIVQDKLQEMGVKEGKMFGVLIAKSREGGDTEGLYFLAAYSGQLNGEASPPTPLSRGRGGTLRNFEWFVPPIVDYFNPECYFQKEQREIMGLGRQMDALKNSEEVRATKAVLELLKREREEAIVTIRTISVCDNIRKQISNVLSKSMQGKSRKLKGCWQVIISGNASCMRSGSGAVRLYSNGSSNSLYS